MKERGESIYIEGVDCSGKTTVGQIVADNLGIEQVNELLLHPETNPWNAEHTGEISTNHPLFPAYLFRAAIWDILHYDPQTPSMQISFAVLRSTAYQAACDKPLEPVFEELVKYTPRFKHPFVLHASIEARQERLLKVAKDNGKSVSKNDELIFTNPEFVDRMGNIIIEKTGLLGARMIDTTDLSIEEVTTAVISQVTENNLGVNMVMSSMPNMSLTEAQSIYPDLPALHRELSQHSRHVAKKHGVPDSLLEKITMPFCENKK